MNHGTALEGKGDLDAAIDSYKQALEIKPVGHHGQRVPNIDREQKKIANDEIAPLDKAGKTLFDPDMASDIIAGIENFYKKRSNDIIKAASLGWFFASSFDEKFICKKSGDNVSTNTSGVVPQKNIGIRTTSSELGLDVNQTIEYLGQHDNLIDRFSELKSLIKSNNMHLINDSFSQYVDTDMSVVQEQTFRTEGFNIVIIGAGATGLFLASIIKSGLGEAVNVLVLDNRSKKKNTREIFSRNWLTHIPVSIVQKLTPKNVKELFSCFGKNGLIGMPINALEAILMLSCKDQGVKFHFSPNLDLSNLNNRSIDCFFDATAGRLKGSNYQLAKGLNVPMQIQKISLDFSTSNVNQLNNLPCLEPDYLQIMLKSSGHFYYPYVENSKIYTHMCKLTGIPIKLVRALRDFVKPRNAFNLFYIWEGALIDEINEGLILINLTNQEYEILTSCIHNQMNLSVFLKNYANMLPFLNEKIVSLIKILSELDTHEKACIEIPFTYSPYINLDPESGQFNGKPIFPIGDSLFCGHPKVGNGLSEHLKFLNDLVLEVIGLRKPISRGL